jgi:hypothetical protein
MHNSYHAHNFNIYSNTVRESVTSTGSTMKTEYKEKTIRMENCTVQRKKMQYTPTSESLLFSLMHITNSCSILIQ